MASDKRVQVRFTTKVIEDVSAAVHEQWMQGMREQGVTSRLMVPYADLPEAAKDVDRRTVSTVLAALRSAGYYVAAVPAEDGGTW